MTLFKLPLHRFFHKSTPIVANTSLHAWCQQSHIQSTRLVRKVEICTALTAGNDAWGMPIDEIHYHTLLRVHLDTAPEDSNNVLLIERVLSTCDEYHSVTPIPEMLSSSGTLFHPDVYDRICVTSERSSAALARQLEVERTLIFGDDSLRGCLTLAQLAQVLGFVSRATRLICAGGDCKFQSRSFAFTCMAALTPRFPAPMTSGRKSGRGVGASSKYGASMVNDSLFERNAENFLCQVPWLVGRDDAESIQALHLITSFKDDPMRA